MKTLKTTILAVVLILTGLNMQAQKGLNPASQKEEKFEKILEKKLAYMKENLLLTKQESVAFEKLYTQYRHDKMVLHKAINEEFGSKVRKGQYLDMSDKELNKLLDKRVEIEKKRMQLELDFNTDLRKILPPKKVIKFYKLEKSFNKKMMKRLGEHRHKKGKRRRAKY